MSTAQRRELRSLVRAATRLRIRFETQSRGLSASLALLHRSVVANTDDLNRARFTFIRQARHLRRRQAILKTAS